LIVHRKLFINLYKSLLYQVFFFARSRSELDSEEAKIIKRVDSLFLMHYTL